MSRLHLEIVDGQERFRPGETVAGVADWQLDARPRSVEVRLFWYTQGKGTVDVHIVGHVAIDSPAASGLEPFELTLPAGPHSCSGQLVSVVWAIELVIDPDERTERLEITVSPSGEELALAGPGEGNAHEEAGSFEPATIHSEPIAS